MAIFPRRQLNTHHNKHKMLTSFCEKSTQKLACYFDVTNKEKHVYVEPACDEVTEL